MFGVFNQLIFTKLFILFFLFILKKRQAGVHNLMQSFLDQKFLNNTVLLYITALGVFIIFVIAVKVFKKIVLYRLKKWSEKTETTIDDFLVKSIENSFIPLLYFGALYLAVNTLVLSPKISNIIEKASIILVTFFVLRVFTSGIRFILDLYLSRKREGETRRKEIRGLTTLISILIWTLGFVFLLDNLGFNISAVIAGLGVGGIAIALAAQAILGDLFGYFVIFFDRPFEIGDFIVVGDKAGAIEYIGIKTTRIRALGGEQLVFSNKELTNSIIHNYKKMERRRVVFHLGVIYQTKAVQLAEIPGVVKEIIQAQTDATFDRGHFANYGDSSLNFEFVYYVIGADYTKYMDIQQAINMKIFEEFEKRGIEFAYPTQTLFVSKDNGN